MTLAQETLDRLNEEQFELEQKCERIESKREDAMAVIRSVREKIFTICAEMPHILDPEFPSKYGCQKERIRQLHAYILSELEGLK